MAREVLNGLECQGVKITKIDDTTFNYELVDADTAKKRSYPEHYNRFQSPSVELQRNP